jgi:hypothetical protein
MLTSSGTFYMIGRELDLIKFVLGYVLEEKYLIENFCNPLVWDQTDGHRHSSFKSCVEILSHLRKASKPTTCLLICETALNPPLLDPNSLILSNGGMASVSTYTRNLAMMTLLNAEERSQEDFLKILNQSGWKLQSITPLATLADYFIIEGVPDPSWNREAQTA